MHSDPASCISTNAAKPGLGRIQSIKEREASARCADSGKWSSSIINIVYAT
jgi:hypothetical protein